MKVEIKITAEIEDALIQEESEKGYTVDSIIKRIYKTTSLSSDYIYDYEVDSVKEVK